MGVTVYLRAASVPYLPRGAFRVLYRYMVYLLFLVNEHSLSSKVLDMIRSMQTTMPVRVGCIAGAYMSFTQKTDSPARLIHPGLGMHG